MLEPRPCALFGAPPLGARRVDSQASPAIEFSHGTMFFHDIDRCENSSMLIEQAYQQHRLAVVHPNKAKSFPAVTTVPVVAKLGHRRRGKRGARSEERKNARRAHASKQKCRRWRSRGVVGVPHPKRRKNEGKNLGRKHLELSKRWRVFARKKRRGQQAERKFTRNKHKAARARSRLESSRSVRSTFAQQRSMALTVSATSTPC